MRVLVTGGRDYADQQEVYATLDELHQRWVFSLLIHGGASGADELADQWAKARGVPILPFPVTPVEWSAIGRKAGPLRNSRMLAEGKPDLCIAFPGNRGTADMVAKCRKAGVRVVEVIA